MTTRWPTTPRGRDDRPWCLTVSFTHPHDPYVARRRFWDLYEDCPEFEPTVPAIPYEDQDPHSQRLYLASDYKSFDITPENVRRSRRAYYANISYLDEKIGALLDVLDRTRMRDDTEVVFLSDHGDMLGERGLWFKMSFYEGSSRVPLMVSVPGLPAGRVAAPVSTLDVVPTLAAIRWKYNHCDIDPPQLFDLENDPRELADLAADPAHAGTAARFAALVREHWDTARFDAEVRQSQARRRLVYEALRNGSYYPWDYQPLQRASERYMRNHMDLNVLEETQRFPRGE